MDRFVTRRTTEKARRTTELLGVSPCNSVSPPCHSVFLINTWWLSNGVSLIPSLSYLVQPCTNNLSQSTPLVCHAIWADLSCNLDIQRFRILGFGFTIGFFVVTTQLGLVIARSEATKQSLATLGTASSPKTLLAVTWAKVLLFVNLHQIER